MSDQQLVTIEIRDAVAVVTMHNPPVNTLARPVRRALHDALVRLERDEAVAAVVLTGERHFCAGADLAEFDSGEGLAEPTLHLTIAGLLDTSRLPSIAAISGVALGGGLELALACSARVVAADSQLGLPETTLGFMPGAGGTQRLPRAIGAEEALALITTGRSIDGRRAQELGLADEVAESPVEAAVALARRLADGELPRQRLRDAPLPRVAAAFLDLALRDAVRARYSVGVRSAIEAMLEGAEAGFDPGRRRELALFRELAATPEARARRYRFLSERSGRGPIVTRRSVGSVAVIGAGTMGRGIALAFLSTGFRVALTDADDGRVAQGMAGITATLDAAVAKGRLTQADRGERLGRLSGGSGLAAAADVDLVVEAVFEDLDVKRAVFAELSRVARPTAILASNTSSLDLDQIADAVTRPEQVVGMHFFSPANVMRLVEVVEGSRTSAASLRAAIDVVKRLGKLPVVAKVGPGFIGNRVFDAYLRQAQLLLAEGVEPARVDRALENWGMAMGPFRVLDLVGNDVPQLARRARGDKDPAWAIADRVADAGWHGRKTGRGWYVYDGAGAPTENADVIDLLPRPTGTSSTSDDEIVERCILAMVHEGAAVLADGIAESGADIDTVVVHGYGFPADRGGPWFWAAERGWERTEEDIERLRLRSGDEFWSFREFPTPQAVSVA